MAVGVGEILVLVLVGISAVAGITAVVVAIWIFSRSKPR